MFLQRSDHFISKLLLVVVLFIGPASGLSQTVGEPAASSDAISYGFVIDNSGSFRKLLEDVIQFVGKVTEEQKPADEVFFLKYADSEKIRLDQEFTGNRSDIIDSSESMYIQAGQPALVDAVRSAGIYFSEHGRPETLRSVVIVTDGDDRGSLARPDDAIKILKEAKIRLFAVAVSDEKVQTKLLDRMTRETGGKLFVLRSKTELRTIAGEVAAAIRKP